MGKAILYTTIGCVLLLLAASLVKSRAYSIATGGTDLRCRIVSARLQATGRSPYFYHWQPPDGERLLDPGSNPSRKVNGNVVTPAVLTLLYPLAELPYPVIRIAWGLLQYGFLLGCFLLIYPGAFKRRSQLKPAPWIVLGLFACSTIWFYNIERGQVYSFYLFLFALIYRLSQSPRHYGRFIAGCVGGLCVFVRPLLAVLSIPFLAAKDIRWLGGFATGIVLGVLVFVLPKPGAWSSYLSAMNEYGKETLGYTTYDPGAVVKDMPASIEGTTNLQRSTFFNTGGLTTLQFYFRTRGIVLPSKALIAGYGVLVLLLLFFYSRGKNGMEAGDRLFLFGFLLYITAELFLVGFRGGYNLVQWFFPAIVISRYWPAHKNALLLIITAVFLLNGWLPQIPHLFELTELLLFGVLAWVCFFGRKVNI